MSNLLSERRANIHIKIIGIFYLISGVWEFLHIMQGESTMFFLVDLYHIYTAYLGFITFWIGIGILCKVNFIRKLALILAWWNLFTAPIFEVWWYIYSVSIKKISVGSPVIFVIFYTVFIIILLTFSRLYIISMLRTSKAGYIFLKKYKEEAVRLKTLKQNL